MKNIYIFVWNNVKNILIKLYKEEYRLGLLDNINYDIVLLKRNN